MESATSDDGGLTDREYVCWKVPLEWTRSYFSFLCH